MSDEPVEACQVSVTHWKCCKLDDLGCLGVQICGTMQCNLIQSMMNKLLRKISLLLRHWALSLNCIATCALKIKHHKQHFPLLHHRSRGGMPPDLVFSLCKLIYLSAITSIKTRETQKKALTPSLFACYNPAFMDGFSGMCFHIFVSTDVALNVVLWPDEFFSWWFQEISLLWYYGVKVAMELGSHFEGCTPNACRARLLLYKTTCS